MSRAIVSLEYSLGRAYMRELDRWYSELAEELNVDQHCLSRFVSASLRDSCFELNLEAWIRACHVHHVHGSLLGRWVDHVELRAGIHAMPQPCPEGIRESLPYHLGRLFEGVPVCEVAAEILSKFTSSTALVVHHLRTCMSVASQSI